MWEKYLPHWYYHWSKTSFQLVSGGPGKRSVGSQVVFRQSKLHSSYRSIRSFSLIFQQLSLFSDLFVPITDLDLVEYWLLDVTAMVNSFAFFIYPPYCYHYYYTNMYIYLFYYLCYYNNHGLCRNCILSISKIIIIIIVAVVVIIKDNEFILPFNLLLF